MTTDKAEKSPRPRGDSKHRVSVVVRRRRWLQLYATGQCGCLDYDLTQGDDWETIYNEMGFASIISEYDDDTKRTVVEAVCGSTIFFGEHLHVSCVPYRSEHLNLMFLQVFAHIRVSQCSIDQPTT